MCFISGVRPGEFSIGPHCDAKYGHPIASGHVAFHASLSLSLSMLYVNLSPRIPKYTCACRYVSVSASVSVSVPVSVSVSVAACVEADRELAHTSVN
eukprot:3401521-Rhodomonas_salina.1